MANKVEIYIKEYNDTAWTDITNRVVKADFKIRTGFSTLGGSINFSKLDITYRASDLAVAAIFHTTAKQIRIKRNGQVTWEGYTEGNSSVVSTAITSLAWVKITAYPYIHALEGLTATSDEAYFNVYMSQPQQKDSSLLHILWNAMLNKCASPYKESLQTLYTLIFPTITVQRSIVVLEKGTKYLSVFLEILKQYTYVLYLDGFTIRTIRPYADDYRTVNAVDYTNIQTNPTIKTSPYIVETQPVVTLTRIKTVTNCTVYSLAESDNVNAEEELYIGMSHPSEGDYEEVSYSNSDIETDTCKLIYAKTPILTYKARYSDNSADAVLREDVKELGATSAKIKLTNTSTTLSCFLNQMWIKASTAYFEDTSIQVSASTTSARETKEESTKWLSDKTNAEVYINAMVSEQKASTSSVTFKSCKLSDVYVPNTLIKIGDIEAVYLIKSITENITTGEREYTCGIFQITTSSSELWRKESKSLLQKGAQGDSYSISIQSTAGTIFKSNVNTSTILICRIYKNYTEDDATGAYKYIWSRALKDGTMDSSFVPVKPTDAQLTALGIDLSSDKAILVYPQNMDELNTYFCEVEEQ